MNALEVIYKTVKKNQPMKEVTVFREIDDKADSSIQIALDKLVSRGALDIRSLKGTNIYTVNDDFSGSFKYKNGGSAKNSADEALQGVCDDILEELRTVKSELYQLKQEVRANGD
jgi:hypothetical protein